MILILIIEIILMMPETELEGKPPLCCVCRKEGDYCSWRPMGWRCSSRRPTSTLAPLSATRSSP